MRKDDPRRRQPLSENQLAEVYHLPINTLRSMRQRGADTYDARSVFKMLMKTTRKPDEWREFFASDDEDSHEYWKREKTKEEVEGLRLKNAKAAGEMFDRADGDRVQEQVAAAFKIGLSERRGTAPQVLAGKDEAWISHWMEEADHELLTNLSDLNSGLWKEVFDEYAASDVGKGSGSTKPAAKGNGK